MAAARTGSTEIEREEEANTTSKIAVWIARTRLRTGPIQQLGGASTGAIMVYSRVPPNAPGNRVADRLEDHRKEFQNTAPTTSDISNRWLPTDWPISETDRAPATA